MNLGENECSILTSKGKMMEAKDAKLIHVFVRGEMEVKCFWN